MSLSPGARVGAYEVKALLGEGGMGQVYRARDTKLNRDVAIKVLPDLFATDADRLARFTREAQALAALNHPNIAAIYGIEDRALVMELVEGEDLSTQIARGPIPFAEALPIARQIADALDAAHAQGIIHRDLKPANIKVRPDGTVKVLDFGLAKAIGPSQTEGPYDRPEGALTNSPTLTARATQMGMIIGTAAYMAPEQAKGRPVDRRADVWAFGCVLYEMLTGRRAFEGEDITDTLAAIVRGEPDWARLPAGLPPTARVLIERCLIKDRTDRLADMSVVRFLLSDTAKTMSGAAAQPTVSAPAAAPAPRRIAPLLLVAATAAVAIVATYGFTRWLGPAASGSNGAGGLAHVSIAMPEGDEIGEAFLRPLAISDDGARVAFVRFRDGKTKIYVRTLSEPTARVLEGTDGGASPFFSPDGQWVGFFAGAKLRRIAVGGAALQVLADAPVQRGGSWSTDGFIYFAPTNSGTIWRVPQDGSGPATEVTRKDPASGEINHRWPHVVPGTNTLLFGVWKGPGDDEQGIAMQTIGTAGHHLLVGGANAPRYATAPGVLIYSHLGELFAVRWRPTDTSLGQAVPVAMPELTSDSGGNEGSGNYAVSRDGTLAYISGGRGRDIKRLVWIDRAGKVEPSAWPERVYENVTIGPDGTRAIVQIKEGKTGLWMADLARHTLTPIGSNVPGSSQAPLWTHDGARVIYRATRKGLRNLYWRAADGSGDEEALTSKPDVVQAPTSVTPDGEWVVFNEGSAQATAGVWMVRLVNQGGDRTPRPVFTPSAGESDGQISPNGKWIAFQAPVSSRQETFVAPFPGPGPRQQISNGGGAEPLWSRDGRELFFQSGVGLMGVTVTPGPTLSASAPRVVHEGHFLASINGITPYTITKDGRRFLRVQQVDPARVITHVSLVLNWFEEVARLVK
jgi:serine/threonine-protein kinase